MKRTKPDKTPPRRRIWPFAVGVLCALVVALLLGLTPLLRERSLASLPLAELERRATDPSASPRLDFYLGEAQRHAGKIPEALVTLGRAMQRDPDYVPAYVAFARALLAAGRPKEAAEVTARVLRVDTTERDAAIVYANALLDQGFANEAAILALQATRRYPDSAEAWLVAGLAQAQANQRPNAEASLRQALTLDDSLADAHRVLGDILLAAARREESRQHLDRALTLAPDDPLVHLVLARWHLARGTPNDLVEARRHLDRPAGPHPPLEYFLARGELARGEERWEEAIRYLRQAARMGPREYRVFFQLSQAYRGAGRGAEAEEAFHTYRRLAASASDGQAGASRGSHDAH
jgi:tetratricopeptide (TPR) repeat protein